MSAALATTLGGGVAAVVLLWILSLRRRFRADPANAGRVLDSGLWRYTRHPNYFGDALAHWGMFAVAIATPAALAIVGPALMTFLLLRVSGVALLERSIGRRRPAYEDYQRRTSAFFPLPPRDG
jgi:steroid 5-alpha reductase family enzyme